MGKSLKPLCVTTNNEHVYFVASAVRYNDQGDDEGETLCALVRSERQPVSLTNATWTLVSTFPAPVRLDSSPQCTVDRNGIFALRVQGTYPNMVRYTFDPTAPIHPNGRTFTSGNSSHGEWSNVELVLPSESNYYFMSKLYIRPEDVNGKAVETLVYHTLMEDEPYPYKTPPVFSSGQYNETWGFDYRTLSKYTLV